MTSAPGPADPAALADWRRLVAEMYARVRAGEPAEPTWQTFRRTRDALFRDHTQSPIPESSRKAFRELDYFPYDPSWRVEGRLEHDLPREETRVTLPHDGPVGLVSFARVGFEIRGTRARLTLYWIQGYGGGVFLPFRDQTAGEQTFGGGRYLFDTIKGADLGISGTRIPLDFNYAYNPSCAYADSWVCPLAPPENRLPFQVLAGEKTYR